MGQLVDPDACMARILAAVKAGDKSEANEAMADLLGWLQAGGFAPKFRTEWAGTYGYPGAVRQVMPFHLSSGRTVHIQLVSPDHPERGWELVLYTWAGDMRSSWRLADES